VNGDFLCNCGHRNKMHSSVEDALFLYQHVGRMCYEYQDVCCINGKFYNSSEEICKCDNFIPDNLKYLEELNK
jgi:hypothetical protein